MFRELKRALRRWMNEEDVNTTCCSPAVKSSSSFGPQSEMAHRQRQHTLSSLIDTLSPVAQELMQGWLETQDYKSRLTRDTQRALLRDEELTKILVETYKVDLETFRDLLKLEENL